MTYSITWAVEALAMLARVLRDADDPNRIQKASDWLDYTLRRIPFDVGESRAHKGERVWYGDVLGVYSLVDEVAMTVSVISVGPSRRR